MKKTIRKTLLSLVAVALVATVTACGGRSYESSETINSGKVQLLVGNMKGGYGKTWLNKAKERFEAKYENYDFGNGKIGVQILIDDNTKYSGAIESKIQTYPQHVILSENINYYNLVDITKNESKFLVDMSDVVNTPINMDLITGAVDTAYGEGSTTIADIMNPNMKEYLDVTGEGVFYGIPFYEATVGIVYDIDIFEKYGFYYAYPGYGDSDGFIQDKDGNWIGENGKVIGKASEMSFTEALNSGVKLSKGGDDVSGTYDDGTPRTYAEFFKMCERMDERNVVPMTWPGNPEIQRYLNYLAYNLWCDYEGVDQMNLNFSLNGTATNLINLDSYNAATGSYEVFSEAITNANGYKLQMQAGKFESINFIYNLVNNPTYYDGATCSSDTNQVEAERRYILSALPDQKDRAMLIDGSWWQSEAKNIFQDMAVDYGDEYALNNRRYGMLPLPKANESKVGEKSSLAFNTSTVIMINKKTTEDPVTLKVAKQFVKFLETHESLFEFNKVTGTARPYSYSLSEDELAELTGVAKQNYELHTATNFIFPYSKNPIVRKNPERFSSSGYLVYQSGGNLNEIISLTFMNNSKLTGFEYFKSMVEDHSESFWKTTFGNDI